MPKVTAEKKQMILDTILGAAESLFSEKGYHGTSMDDIVKASGYSKGAIYGHFDSKEQLFLSVLEKQTDTSLEGVKSLFSPDDSAWTKLEKTLALLPDSMFDESDEQCRLTFELQLQASRQKSWRSKIQKQYSRALRFLAEIIEEGQETGEFRKDVDAESLAGILIGSSNGLSLYALVTGKSFDWNKIKDTLRVVVNSGIVV
ncbi:MAG: TetR/AcrR family transcriptional regulator [Candidatus Thorarchaeota archaeon]